MPVTKKWLNSLEHEAWVEGIVLAATEGCFKSPTKIHTNKRDLLAGVEREVRAYLKRRPRPGLGKR